MHSSTLPPSRYEDDTDRSGLSFQAAKAARLMPLFMILTGWIFRTVKANHPEYERWTTILFGATVVCLTLLAATFALIALCGIPRHGARGLLLPALIGISVPALVGTIAVPNFLKARETALQNRAKLQELAAAGNELKQETRQNLESDDPAGKGVESLDKFQGRLDAASSDMGGIEQAVVKATSSFVGQLKIELRRYEAAARPVRSGNVLDASTLRTRADLQARQQQMSTFLAANAALKKFIGQYKAQYRRQLEHAGLRGAQLEEALAGVTHGSDQQYSLLLKIRDTDDQLGKTTQQMLAMLDQHWGQWRCLRAHGPVQFENAKALATWNTLFARLESTATEQARLQRQLVQQL